MTVGASVRRRVPSVLLVLGLVAAGARCESSREGRDVFREGRRLVTVGHYEEALPVLERYLAEHPQGRQASRAGLFVGKAHLGLGELERAALAFEATARDYPDSLEAHKSRYKLALIALLRGERGDARARFAALAEAPDGPLAPEARAMRRMLDDG